MLNPESADVFKLFSWVVMWELDFWNDNNSDAGDGNGDTCWLPEPSSVRQLIRLPSRL